MRVFLFLLSVLSFLVGCAIVLLTEGAIHEIEGLVLVLVGAVLLSGASIVEALKPVKRNEELLLQVGVKLCAQLEVLDSINTALSKGQQQPPLAPGQEKYHVAIDGEVTGPYTIPEIRALAKRGSVDGSMKVAKVGDKTWLPLSSLLE